MDRIRVAILDNNLNGMPLFLAKLTQRGSEINNIDDLLKLYAENIEKVPSAGLLKLPHDTICRMCHLTVAIYGLSTKAVSQLRTHATRLTFMSTSTQYSEFTKVDNPYVVPRELLLNINDKNLYEDALKNIHASYKTLYELTKDKDSSGYLLPQSLRKSLIISGNFPAWKYMLSLRTCHRNTKEVQYVCEMIVDQIRKNCGEVWADQCLPNCCTTGCEEGKFCCGKKYVKEVTYGD